MVGYLTLVDENYDTESTVPKSIVLSGERMTIGRGSVTVPVDVTLAIKAHGREIISRCHAEIINKSQGIYEICDKGSINGVFVNNIRIEKAILKEGDRIQFGGVAKVPIGKVVKHSAEHATYIFSCRSEVKSKNQSPNSSSTILASHPSLLNSSLSSIPTPISTPTSTPTSTTTTTKSYSSLNVIVQSTALELEQRNQLLQNEINVLKQKLSQLTKNPCKSIGVNTSPPPRAVEFTPPSSVTRQKSECLIDFSALQDLLKCSLCQLILLDAVVCRCSHGFCRACLETYYRNKAVSSSSLLSPTVICPICVGESKMELNKKRKFEKVSSADQNNYSKFYFRSSNLDSVVYLLQQTRSAEEMKMFNQREKDHHQILRKYGIDPLASPLDLDDQDQDQDQEQDEQEEDHEHDNDNDKDNEELGEVELEEDEVQQLEVTHVVDEETIIISPKKDKVAQTIMKKIVCDYCGEEEHGSLECPHDDNNERNKRSRYGQYHEGEDQMVDSEGSDL